MHKTNVRAIYLRILSTYPRSTSTAATGTRKAQGAQTRAAILESAVHIASVEGLEGLTIGRLAAELKLSKSGLFAHFGSKEELQLATVDAARAIAIREVIGPALKAPAGLPRLWNLCDLWLGYVESGVFRGGCFFAAVAAEFDSRPGPVRDRIAEIMDEWIGALRRAIVEAQNAGHVAREADPDRLAFEFNALELGANSAMQLHGCREGFTYARDAILDRLQRNATAKGASLLPSRTETSANRKRITRRALRQGVRK